MRKSLKILVHALILGMVTACSSLSSFKSDQEQQPKGTNSLPLPPPPRPDYPIKKPDDLKPEQLLSLSGDETIGLLGNPTTRSNNAMATVWTYSTHTCSLTLLFYPEIEAKVERVFNYTFEGKEGAISCLAHLREDHSRHGK